MSSILVTGSNRGLGLEMVRQYAADGWRVFACCRRPAEAAQLEKLADGSNGAVSVHPLDVTHQGSVDVLADELAGTAIDLLINNAGVFGRKGNRGQHLGGMDYESWSQVLDANVLGPMRMVEAFADSLAAGEGRLLITISSEMGSITNNPGGFYAYRSSKAAVNCVMKGLSQDLRSRGIVVVTLNPGWVRTDMGGPEAELDPEESVRALRQVIAGLEPQDSGKFFSYTGEELPW